MRRLLAWDGPELAGVFEERADGEVGFAYDGAYRDRVSLSLPAPQEGRRAEPGAARNFLEGLLPESPGGRAHMQHALGARSDDAFDLLDAVDSAGGLVFTYADRPPAPGVASVSPVASGDMEAQLALAARPNGSWWDPAGRARFSMAGSQGKFTLALVGGAWFWPSAALPSTHIVKPEPARLPGAAAVEDMTMELAREAGLAAPASRTFEAGGRVGYVIERFDREIGAGGRARRLKTEDLCQALGLPASAKYDVEIPDVARRLCEAGLGAEAVYAWLGQVAFNSLVGNFDAHAKNYSLYTGMEEPGICPLYDCICMQHWPEYRDDVLAVPVNGVYDPWEVRLSDWRAEAARCGLDADRVEGIVLGARRGIEEADLESLAARRYAGQPREAARAMASEIKEMLAKCSRDLTAFEEGPRAQGAPARGGREAPVGSPPIPPLPGEGEGPAAPAPSLQERAGAAQARARREGPSEAPPRRRGPRL